MKADEALIGPGHFLCFFDVPEFVLWRLHAHCSSKEKTGLQNNNMFLSLSSCSSLPGSLPSK